MATVCLTFFHRKLGPVIHCACPRGYLSEPETKEIARLMDTVFTRDNFVTSAVGQDKTALNYFFELPSKWAKQNKELLMLSIIFAEEITPGSQEEQVRSKIREFVQKLKEIEDIFKGFYVHDKLHFQIAQRNQILAKRTALKKLVGDFQHSLEVELELAPF